MHMLCYRPFTLCIVVYRRFMIKFILKMASLLLSEFTQKAVKVFRECAHVPSVSRARVFRQGEGSCFEVEAAWTQRELERGKKVVFTKSYFVQREGCALKRLCGSTFQSDATQVVKVAYSSDDSVKAVLLKDKTAKAEPASKPQQYIEVWRRGKLAKTIEVDSLKKHGTINEDIHFGSFQLSSNGRQLLYVAEKEKPKSCSFFKKQESKSNDEKDEKSKPVPGTEYVFESNWGEQLMSVVNPLPVVLDIDSEECTVIDISELGDISGGQAQWVPGDEGGVVFVGVENKPRKLGFVYCMCRRSALYYWKDGKFTTLTSNKETVFSPRFNAQGSKLVFFEGVPCGPHHTCAALKMIEWSSKSVTTVIDIVQKPEGPGSFAGYYTFHLPERCWDSKGEKLLNDESWASERAVTCTDVGARKVTKVTSGEDRKGAWSVLDVSHDIIVAQFSTPNTAPQLFVGVLPENETTPISWTQLSTPEEYEFLDGVNWQLLNFNPKDGSDLPYEAIFITPKVTPTSTPPPLVVLPHGGPHVLFSIEFYSWVSCLAALGFAVLLVNYRGSAGYGQEGVFSLLGKVGRQDVDDVQAAAVSLVERGVVNKEQVVVLGGSHGGFLACHLIGQFPDFYKAASMRNPVINLASLIGVNDIPDWTYVESGMTFDPAEPPTSDALGKFLSKSPISFVDKIKAPVLISLGVDDMRVPNPQGHELYNILKARGKETKLLHYPGDCHPIASVYSDGDSFINTAVWFYRYAVLDSQQQD